MEIATELGAKLENSDLTDPIQLYNQWLLKQANLRGRKAVPSRMRDGRKPLFSVLLPTWNSPSPYFQEQVANLQSQTYADFEVCLSDDASTSQDFVASLTELAEKDSRFRVHLSGAHGGISVNTNRTISMAQGMFLVFCDHDDLIAPHALESIAEYLNRHPETDLVYSDEDMIDENGTRHSPRLQPDWNPDLFLSHMYFPHLIAVRTSLARKIGPLVTELDGAQDYDFFLRASEQARHIGHIPEVLYSWRILPGSVALDIAEKPSAPAAGRRALERAMQRRGIECIVLPSSATVTSVSRVKRKILRHDVTHIIEVRSLADLVALRNMRDMADMPVRLLAVIEQGSSLLATAIQENSWLEVVPVPFGANRANYYNAGARYAGKGILLFSCSQLEICDCDYPSAMVEQAQRSEIGVVGCKILYPNGKFFHTGIILGVNGFCGYAHRNIFVCPGYWQFAATIRNYTAVAWELMAVDYHKWQRVGGFDVDLPGFVDVDFCLKIQTVGARNLYTPYVTGIINRKVQELKELQNDEAAELLLGKFGKAILADPCYHPLLSRNLEDFSLYHQGVRIG